MCCLVTFMVDTAGRLMSKSLTCPITKQGLSPLASSAVAAATDDLIDTRPIRRYFVLFSQPMPPTNRADRGCYEQKYVKIIVIPKL